MASSLYTISAYKRFLKNVLPSDTRGKLYLVPPPTESDSLHVVPATSTVNKILFLFLCTLKLTTVLDYGSFFSLPKNMLMSIFI